MSDKIYHISKNSIFVKIMKYIWNLDHKSFSHMCPFFWLTIFNVIIIIPYFTICELFRMLKYMIKLAISALDKYFEELDRKAYEKLMEELKNANPNNVVLDDKTRQKLWKRLDKYGQDDDQAYKIVRIVSQNSREKEREVEIQKAKEEEERYRLRLEREREEKRLKEIDKFKKVAKKLNLSEEEITTAINNNTYNTIVYRFKETEEEKERARIIENKKRINKILKIIKPIITIAAYSLGSIIVLFSAYYLIIGCYNLFEWFINIDWTLSEETKKVLIATSVLMLIIVAGILGVVLIFRSIKAFEKRTFESKPVNKVIKQKRTFKVNISFNWLATLWGYICYPFKKIREFISLFIQMLKNECPPIKWED